MTALISIMAEFPHITVYFEFKDSYKNISLNNIQSSNKIMVHNVNKVGHVRGLSVFLV